ncbi:MAG TPA: type II secretion system F family protein [Persephonella sp.]|uniref:Type IV pilus biogenesis protein PilC n=1 Tax=Persephonella marina (strain DSM 14350 / EX-H1) TaxID=123214 RepID=C0QRH6_PERMH|nr:MULTISPECIES: type II secretion system F family protein [Persephonella]ACO04187.1 type IV pilus biogenesis protein PilC [Persephonella marina EX-H1]HCB69017.1 type II secretion system F family protein [Persephonella sp.]
MPKFIYTARDKYGVLKKDTIYASDVGAAETELTKQGYQIIRIELAPKKEISIDIFKPKVKEKDLAIFTRQLGAMISAGVGIAEALEILSEQIPNKTLADALKSVKEDVMAGMSLAKAMEKHPKAFPEFLVNLTAAAEESGNLDVILKRATVYYEKIAAIKRKLISASWYPAMVVVIATVIVLGILTFIVPTFAQLYKGMGSELPFLTQFLIDASNFVKANILYIFAGIFGLFILNGYIYKTRAGKEFWHRVFLNLPLLGEIFRKGAVAKFSRTLSTLVSGGVPIIRALEIASTVAGNVVIEKSINKTKDEVEKGKQIYQSLDPKLFPPIFIAMVRVGENTGRLDEMLDTIADFFEDEVDRAVEGLLSTIEPLLMVFIGGIVGVILVGLYLPIFKLGELMK